MKHHGLIILLTGDIGYISVVGHGQSQPIFHSYIITVIAIITTCHSVSVVYITFFFNSQLKKCEACERITHSGHVLK